MYRQGCGGDGGRAVMRPSPRAPRPPSVRPRVRPSVRPVPPCSRLSVPGAAVARPGGGLYYIGCSAPPPCRPARSPRAVHPLCACVPARPSGRPRVLPSVGRSACPARPRARSAPAPATHPRLYIYIYIDCKQSVAPAPMVSPSGGFFWLGSQVFGIRPWLCLSVCLPLGRFCLTI